MGIEPTIGVLQTPALTTWPRRLTTAWCRGGDLNPYALTGTAPSRRRVYRFHHLGESLTILSILELLASGFLSAPNGAASSRFLAPFVAASVQAT